MSKIAEVSIAGENLPVYELNDAGEDVSTVARAAGGFIPLTSPADADFSQIRISTENMGTLSPHTEPTLFKYFIEPGLVEDWESGSTDQWEKHAGYSGDTLTTTTTEVYNGDLAGKVTNTFTGSTPSFKRQVGQFTPGTSVGSYMFLTGNDPAGSIRMWDDATKDQLLISAATRDDFTRILFRRGRDRIFDYELGYPATNLVNQWKFLEIVWDKDKTAEANIYDDIPPAYPNGVESSTLLNSFSPDDIVDNFEPDHIMIHAQGYGDQTASCIFDDISLSINR
jgi:hypothetical protein